jgi:hypothetical protein
MSKFRDSFLGDAPDFILFVLPFLRSILSVDHLQGGEGRDMERVKITYSSMKYKSRQSGAEFQTQCECVARYSSPAALLEHCLPSRILTASRHGRIVSLLVFASLSPTRQGR